MRILVIITSVFLLFFTACTDKYNFPPVNESFSIINQTDTSFFVEFGYMQVDTFIVKDSVSSLMNTCRFIDKPILSETELWMSESQFNEYAKTLKIYRIENNDSVFVNSAYFNNRTLWNSTMDKYYDMGAYIFINHLLEIKPYMFE